MRPPALLLALLALALLLWQARRLVRAAAVRRAARAGYLDACLPLLDGVIRRTEPHGFPRVAGTCRGAPIDLRVVPDALAVRKLPALWLLVTLTEPTALRSTFHLMLRPRGAETFSAFDRLPHAVPPPPGLPRDCAVRTDGAGGPAPALLARAVERLGTDRLKEVVLSPRGLRLTWLAEEADRGRYLLFRDAETGLRPLAPEVLEPLLATLLDLRAALAAAPERRRA